MSDQIDIREMRGEDILAVHEIETLCFPDPWSVEAFESEMSGRNPCFYLVAEVDGRVAGYAGIWHIVDEGHITNIAVHPDYRRRHLGDLLVANLLKTCGEQGMRAFTLEVRVSNEAAIKLYEKYGFQVAGTRKNYYGTEDALIMWWRNFE